MIPSPVQPDPLAAAGLAALLAGVAGIFEPFFLGLAMAASALAGLAGLPKLVAVLQARSPGDGRWRPAVGGIALLGAWGIYLFVPGPLDRFAGLGLGVAGAALWLLLRSLPEPRGPAGAFP